MQIGQQTAGFGFGRPVMPAQAASPREAEGPSRGERLVGRLDRDNDGKLGLSEIADSKLGRRMTVDRFARLDTNGDNALDARELGDRPGKGLGWAWGARAREAMMQNVVTAQMADYLTQRVPEAMPGEDLVNAVIARLDADGSGALNSEEIAGTRLAEKIGAGFYDLDGDRSGTLDTAELGAFIRAEVLGLADPATPPEAAAVADVATTDPVTETVTDAPAELAENAETGQVGDAAETATVDVPAGTGATPNPAQAMLSAFETALQMIEDGQETRSTYDVVSALYGKAQSIFAA